MATIRKRDRKDGRFSFEIRIRVGTKPDGKPDFYYETWEPPEKLTEAKAKKEVKKYADELESKIKRGVIVPSSKKFSDYAEYVIRFKVSRGMKKKTAHNYRFLLKNRINPEFGDYFVDELTVTHLNYFYTKLLEDGNSPKTVKEYHTVISTVLEHAKKESLIEKNPAKEATLPKRVKKPVQYYEPEDIIKIREALEEHAPLKWRVITYILLASGARRGEVLGLKEDDFDFFNNQIRFDSEIVYTSDDGVYEDSTKTENVRWCKMPQRVMELAKLWIKEYKKAKLLYADRWHDTGFIFFQAKPGNEGKPMHPDSPTGWMSKFSKKYDLPHMHPHAFRHTNASLLIFEKFDPVTVAKRLGHAQVSTTTNIYSHIIQQANELAADAVEEAIFKPKEKNVAKVWRKSE